MENKIFLCIKKFLEFISIEDFRTTACRAAAVEWLNQLRDGKVAPEDRPWAVKYILGKVEEGGFPLSQITSEGELASFLSPDEKN